MTLLEKQLLRTLKTIAAGAPTEKPRDLPFNVERAILIEHHRLATIAREAIKKAEECETE